MKINGYILANRAQEVPIPTPGTEITSGFSWTFSDPIIYYTCNDVDRGTYNPTGSWKTGTSQSYTQQPNWKSIEGAPPANVGWHQDLYYTSGLSSSEMHFTNITGSITLNISNLPVGKYVAVFDHWFGDRNISNFPELSGGKYMMDELAVVSSKSIKQGANGIVYGEIKGIEEWNPPNTSYSVGCLGGLHFEQRCEFTISQGDTAKTFTYGDSTFGCLTLCGLRHKGAIENKSDIFLGQFYLATTAIRARLYTEV